jgi:hypothetical protein
LHSLSYFGLHGSPIYSPRSQQSQRFPLTEKRPFIHGVGTIVPGSGHSIHFGLFSQLVLHVLFCYYPTSQGLHAFVLLVSLEAVPFSQHLHSLEHFKLLNVPGSQAAH